MLQGLLVATALLALMVLLGGLVYLEHRAYLARLDRKVHLEVLGRRDSQDLEDPED